MSGRPQGRGRQTRRDRSQRNRGRDHSADSVNSTTSTQSERERGDRDREQRNGRNSRRRPDKKDERARRRNEENRRDVPERESAKTNVVEKDKGKQRPESEKPPSRSRGENSREVSRELNRESFGAKGSANERNNMFGDDSRLSHLIKRITKESERERRLTASQQLEEFLNNPDNYQVIDKHAENLFTVLEDVLFERGQPDLKEKVANCVGLIGGILGNEAGRFFQWIFTKLESSISDDVKVLLLSALSKAIQVDTKNKYFRDFMMNVMSSLQNILENVDTSDLLRAALNVMMPIAIDYPHAFAGHFRDTVDILVGWHIDTSQQNSLTSYTSECLVKLHDYWASDLAFSLTLLSQFLEDMEAYAEELGMLSSQVVTSEEIPLPYVSLPRLTALVRVFTTVVNGIGPSFSPNRSPTITPPYLTELIQRIIQCISMSGYSYYYEKLFVSANQCLESMCSWLQPYFSCCCEITASFVIQQLQSSSCVTYPHIMSALQLIEKVIAHVNTAIPASFIQQLLEPGSPVMKLRLSSDQAVLSSVMKIYQGFLGIHDVPLLETAYKIAVTELTDSFSLLKKMVQMDDGTDSNTESQSSSSNAKETSTDSDVGALNLDENSRATNPVSYRSSHELQTILIFDLCALSEIATSKSAILRLWKLSPSPFQLLTQHLDACEWRIAVCHPSVQYTILHAFYTYCQRYNHFLPNSQSEGIRASHDGDVVSMFALLCKVLGNSSTPQDSRKLCLVWLVETLDRAINTGVFPLVSKHISLDSLARSILPSSFDHDPSVSLEISLCLKILVDLKILSRDCLKKFLEDCAVRLMDVNKDVRENYLQLIQALPTDLLTSSLHQSLFESRTTKGKGNVDLGKPLTTSCSDVWLARKSHSVKPPTGSFHSHDFQMVMGFILSGGFPSKDLNVDWLARLFHSCNRVQKYAETEMVQFNRCESLLWFWATWEAAQFCILSRLRTPLGRAQETFQAIEGALQKFVMDVNGEEEIKTKHEDPPALEEKEHETDLRSKPFMKHLQCVLLLQFIENLEKLMYNGYEGCVVGLPSPPKSVRAFFRTNRGTCLEWLTRVRKPAMSVGSACGSPSATVWHGFQTLQEMKTAGNPKGEEFDNAVLLTCEALCELRSAHAISGLMAWCEQVSGQKYSWMNGIAMKAKGWYESSVADYKCAVEDALTNVTDKSLQEERRTNDSTASCTVNTTFLVNEVIDCYLKLSCWDEVAEWQKHVSSLRKQCSDSDVQHSLMANVDLNYVKALSKFEECDFSSVRDHLRLIPGAALNSLTENLTKSAWSVKLNHPDATFTPVWAPEKIEQTAELSLMQAQTLFFTSGNSKSKTKDNSTKDQKMIQAAKECIHHATSLCEGVLRVGTLGWPLEVSAIHISHLQFASAMENILDSTLQQEDNSPSFLQGNGTFTVDHTQHDTAVLIKALRFCGNLHYAASSVGKHQNGLKKELISLQLATAQLARKHHNFHLAQRLLVKQISLLGNPVKIPKDLNCNKKQFLEPMLESLNDPSLSSAKPVDVMQIQRECSKLAFALGHSSEAVYSLADSISQYSNLGDIDSNVGALNARSLLTLAKWLLNDRKLLTAVTKINGNGLSVAMKINSLCELEASYVSLGHSTLIPPQDESAECYLNSTAVPTVASGVTDTESVCGQLLHLATMQSPDLGKAWFNLAGWCYRWGRKTVEQASSMGNVDLLPSEKEAVLQNLPQTARPAEVESVLLVLGQVHVAAYFNQEEDIGEEDQLYDDGVENTKKQLLTVCPGLQDTQSQLLDNLLSVWRGVRDRLFKHYHFAAKAYFMYLRMGMENCDNSVGAIKDQPVNSHCSKNSDDDSNVTATLRLLRLLVKHAGELRGELEKGLINTPTRPWKDITPQLFSRLNHPESYVRQSVSELLCRVGQDAPHLVVYPAVVGCSTTLPKYLLNKGKEGEGLLPLLVSNSSDASTENSQNQGSQTYETHNSTESDALTSCYQTIVESIRAHNPQLISELQGFIMELRRITLLWEELWHGSLMQTHHDVTRRQQQLEEEIKRVNGNQNLTNQQKATLIREKHIAIMKPIVFAIEQLNKITCQETATPHEQWFQMTYSGVIEGAFEALQNPPDPTDHRSSWEPFKQLLQALQARSQKRSAYVLRMDEISPSLAKLKGSAVYMPGQTHFSGKIVTIDSVISEVNILPTKTKPKKLVFVGSDGQRYTYLFKGLEDLHLDERIMQFLSICNNMFARVDSHSSPLFCARHYSVTPLGPRSGLIQWVDGAVPIFALFKRWQQREALAVALVKSAQGANQPPPPPMKPSELYYSKITPALKEKGITDLSSRRDWPLSVMRQVLEELMKETPSDLLAKELWCSSTSAAEWWQMTQSYARSTAVMSMIGYIIGLGDRHLDNMLVDFTTGEVVHIDYNVCFEKGKGLRVPEKVPFRMTPNLETALGVTGVEGVFRLSCEEVLKILKQGRETLLTLLEAFVYDPLVDWTTANDTAFASAFYGGGAPGVTDNKVNKKEMERDVTQCLFSSRVAEMKVTWTNNKDELLSGMGKLDEQLDTYLGSLKQLKSLDLSTEELKDEQETLQAAISNSQHPLHSVQAKFDEKKKLQADHDTVLQTITEKLHECQQWQVQHKAAIETVHGSKLTSLAGELLQPLDLGLPSFAPAISFLQGAGQGHIVNQCEQLETELSGLLHQQRTMFRSCLDLLHTYATVTSLFPSDYVEQNRSCEWQSWLQSLVEDSSTKNCQAILEASEKMHNKPVVDSPLTLAEVTGFMAMEVKLQSSLTEQNAKFIKFSERRKQESVETAFLSKAVGETYAALKKHITGKQPTSLRCLVSVLISALCSLNKRCLAMENTAKVAKDRLSDLTSREGDWFLDELCSMSGNANQLLLLLKDHPLEVKEDQQALLGQAQNSMRAVFGMQKVFTALQELMTKFRTIIVPEAIKNIYVEDPSVFSVVQQLESVACSQKMTLQELTEKIEARLAEGNATTEAQGSEDVDGAIQDISIKFEKLLQSSKNTSSDSGEDSSSSMTSGQMLLAGFNGLFTKVASELTDMFATFEQVRLEKHELKFDVIRDAQDLQLTNSAKNADVLSKLFFLKRLEVIISFFKSCRLVTLSLKGVSSSASKPEAVNCVTEPSNNLFVNANNMSAETKTWNPDMCYSEDDLAVHVKHFIADCVQQCIMGLPSQSLAAVIIAFATILGSKNEKECVDEEGVVSLEEYCKKVVDANISSGLMKSKQLSQMGSLMSAYDVAWRKHDFAKRLDNNMNIYKGVVQRAQLQLARFQWLYEDNLLQCPMRGNSMITPARATVMADLKKRVQSLIHIDSVIKGVEEKFTAQESSIEQRLKWAAGANPALNPVLQNFEQTLAARKKLMVVEGKHSSDICSLSNAILHCEALRTHTADAVGIDNVMTALVKRCQQSSAELESCSEKLHDVAEVAKKVKVSYPPEAPITLDWMKSKLEAVGQEVASIKTKKSQTFQAITSIRDSIKSQASAVKTVMVSHQQLIGEVKSMLTTMAKDEEAAESRPAKLFISTHNRQSEECSQLIKSILAVCSGKISDSRDTIDDSIKEVKAMVKTIKSLVQWVHDHLLSLASPLVPDESGSSGGKTPIAAPPPTFASALRQGSNASIPGSKDSVATDIGSPHPVILQRDTAASPSGAGSPTASARLMAVASPRRVSTANLARDPRTGKALQERNTYAISVWRRVKSKLDGRDQDTNKKMSIADQVDFVIRESRSLDNLSQMYEGWTAWV